jgi:hypothetical protein
MPIEKIWILPVSIGAPLASATSLSVPPRSAFRPPESEKDVSWGGTSVPPATTPSVTLALVLIEASADALMSPRSPHAVFAVARLKDLSRLIGMMVVWLTFTLLASVCL